MYQLEKGDRITIVSPAKAIDEESISYAKNYLESLGFEVIIAPNATQSYHYFSGNDDQRAQDFQQALNDTKTKAILCSRGGYGCIQILDKIDWSNQWKNPKWIIGFSDVTVIHQYMAKNCVPSLHATMPLDFKTGTHSSLDTLINSLKNNQFSYQIESSKNNIQGIGNGKLIGGNLSIIYSLLGTDLQPDYQGKILFLEDVGEAIYAIDRMFHSLKRAKVLDQINGIIIGGMTKMKDSEPPFGKTIERVILEQVSDRNYPVCFHFPAGHQKENLALILGMEVELTVTSDKTILKTVG